MANVFSIGVRCSFDVKEHLTLGTSHSDPSPASGVLAFTDCQYRVCLGIHQLCLVWEVRALSCHVLGFVWDTLPLKRPGRYIA